MNFACSDPYENGITREKVLAKCSGKSPFSESWYLGFHSDVLDFQCVKCLDKHVEQDNGRKSGVWEAEFQKNYLKEWACLQCGGSFHGIMLPVHIQRWQARLGNSKLVYALTGMKVTSRNPWHATGAHWHRYPVLPLLSFLGGTTCWFWLTSSQSRVLS